MEHLSISDLPPQHGGGGGSPLPGHVQLAGIPPPSGPRGPPQLPPQMFTTAAQLLDFTDKKIMVALRDGKKLIGVLRSWDQFANLVLQSTVERIFAPAPSSTDSSDASDSKSTQPNPDKTQPPLGFYADIPRGLFLVRGENVLLLGEIDLDTDDDPPPRYELADVEVVKRLAAEARAAEKAKEKGRLKKLATIGFEGENIGEALL